MYLSFCIKLLMKPVMITQHSCEMEGLRAKSYSRKFNISYKFVIKWCTFMNFITEEKVWANQFCMGKKCVDIVKLDFIWFLAYYNDLLLKEWYYGNLFVMKFFYFEEYIILLTLISGASPPSWDKRSLPLRRANCSNGKFTFYPLWNICLNLKVHLK